MPHSTGSAFEHIVVRQLGLNFAAEVSGIDFSKAVSPEVFAEIRKAITKASWAKSARTHGVLVFRRAGLDDAHHVEFSRLFGELDDFSPYIALGRQPRLPFIELFDVSNQEDDGSLTKINSKRHHMSMGNSIFHVDSSFNPRRASYSLLRAHQLPPPGYGGNTEFADTRTAYDDLPDDLKKQLEDNDYIGCHSVFHSRKKAAPKDSPWLKDLDPEQLGFGRHTLVQTHEPSGRRNLYIANHLHHLEYHTPRSREFVPTPEQPFERVPAAEGTEVIERLLAHATQEQYVVSVEWQNEGDLVVWDNTCVMHRAGEGTFMEKYARDMRRCTVHDGSKDAWGFNPRSNKRMAYP